MTAHLLHTANLHHPDYFFRFMNRHFVHYFFTVLSQKFLLHSLFFLSQIVIRVFFFFGDSHSCLRACDVIAMQSCAGS